MTSNPSWLDTTAYPFTPKTFTAPDGRMSYVDEGEGDVIVMVHGTPTWSFLYRHLIRDLSAGYRVIAPDNLGFGLSEHPDGYSYRPQDQARNLTALIDSLNLPAFTLVVHDFGGPIGLSYAVERPEQIKRLVLLNTWMWSLADDREKVMVGRMLGSPLGGFLYRRFGFSANVILPSAYGDKAKLTPEIHAQYKAPLATPAERESTFAYARALMDSADWYDGLW
ncbi:MAG: alpha/beta fold hydrolase, partial [Chloroflexota bacterium]